MLILVKRVCWTVFMFSMVAPCCTWVVWSAIMSRFRVVYDSPRALISSPCYWRDCAWVSMRVVRSSMEVLVEVLVDSNALSQNVVSLIAAVMVVLC